MISTFTKRVLLTSLALGVTYSEAQNSPERSAQLNFTNSDRLTGSIVGWEDGHIIFKSKHLDAPAHMDETKLSELSFINSGTPQLEDAPPNNHLTTLTLVNRVNQAGEHDTLQGQLSQVTDETITLDTWYAGELVIKRSLIESMNISERNADLYAGPTKLDDWDTHGDEGAWFYKNGSFISGQGRGSIAKEMNTPELAVLRFDMDWKRSLQCAYYLFADSTDDNRPDNYYELNFRSSTAYMRKTTDGGRTMSLQGSKSLRDLVNEKSGHFEVFMNKKSGTFHVYFNGKYFTTFQDRSATPEKMGSAMHIVSSQSTPMRIRNMQLSRWNGNKPNRQTESEIDSLEGEGQRIILQNGDAVVGKIGEIDQGLLELTTQYGEFKIPVARMRNVALKPTDDDQPMMRAGDVKAHFHHGGWIILKLISLDGEKIVGYHQGFGNKAFDLDAFSSIEFNIYNESFSTGQASDEW